MTTLPASASPVQAPAAERLPLIVEVRGERWHVVQLRGLMFDGSGNEKCWVADHDIRVLRLSGGIPVEDRRFVLARALIFLNS